MIRRTLRSGLVAAVAMLALVPTAAVAAVAADGGQVAPAPVVRTVPHRPHILLPAAAGQIPARHLARRSARCPHPARHVRRVVHHRRYRPVVGYVATRHVGLNVRSGPGFRYRVIGHRGLNGRLELVCQKNGSYVHGDPRWYKLAGSRGYVSAHYVYTRSALPWC